MKKFQLKKRKIIFTVAILVFFSAMGFLILGIKLKSDLVLVYKNRQSVIIKDRNGENIYLKPNYLGYYAEYSNSIPPDFKNLLLKKEDKYFYYHLGINPVSALRALYNYSAGKNNLASSTITQQLVKILLENEKERTLKNKFKEALYALSLEIYLSKDEILEMYGNSVYFGNNVQGLNIASRLYFESSPALLSEGQALQLLATISSPSENNPFTLSSYDQSQILAGRLGKPSESIKQITEKEIKTRKENFEKYKKGNGYFELQSLGVDCESGCSLTIDQNLGKNIREIMKRKLSSIAEKDINNGAVVIIKLPENELLSVVGSPDPNVLLRGYQINMAKEPRAAGSVVKPFIYLNGFFKGLRPYTLVEDKEYRYIIGTGFALYPKNYDYQYRGETNLHYALTNSLNVPAVKVLEYVGLDDFYSFLLKDLEFRPVQDMENYQLGIALGTLETDLISLSYYFTIFPNEGMIYPLKIYGSGDKTLSYDSRADFSLQKKVSEEKYAQLINKVLSDRNTGIEQFGIKSELNLLQDNYAVKTGTSREFSDSWTVGYTPDFLVGVWVGNSDYAPMEKVSGQSGAGKIWHETMNLLINSPYNKKTPFDFNLIKEFKKEENVEYGLQNDDYEKQRNLLEDKQIILNPHQNDVFLLEENTQISLKAKEKVFWYVNGEIMGEEKEIIFKPKTSGTYDITAKTEDGREESLIIYVEKEK